jgi:hypothetical protein
VVLPGRRPRALPGPDADLPLILALLLLLLLLARDDTEPIHIDTALAHVDTVADGPHVASTP